MRLVTALCGVWLATATAVPGQDGGAPPAAPAAPSGGGAVIQDNTSGLYFEWALTAIGAGIALFAVCRSSGRN